MIYKIYYEGDRKFALPIKNREQLMKLRNAKTNLKSLEKVRQGDEKAKHDLLQLAYNLGRVEGAIAGCKSIGSFFFHDVDYYDCCSWRWIPLPKTCNGWCSPPVAAKRTCRFWTTVSSTSR